MDQRDPVTGSIISIEQQQHDEAYWCTHARERVAGIDSLVRPIDPADLCNTLYQFLNEQSRGTQGQRPTLPLCDHSPDSYVSDHALLTSAIAYCLGHDQSNIHLIRLAALSHEFPEDVQTQLAACVDATSAATLKQAWAMLRRQTKALLKAFKNTDSLTAFVEQADEQLALLWYAHLTASQPLSNDQIRLPDTTALTVIEKCSDFVRHPLYLLACQSERWCTIGLVHGGATKIKNYVFESAKLPEIRGGSALLDWLNQVGARQAFATAPECIIYANGGELLALTPAAQAQALANALEATYATQTLTAQAVFVADAYTLLELQYGLQPQAFWADTYADKLTSAGAEVQGLLRDYYGHPKDGWTDVMRFHQRKGFGECATKLALKRTWRRDGNTGAWRGQAAVERLVHPHFETLPFGQYCTSCDQRMAIVRIPDLNDALCEPCVRKRWTGWFMRRGERQRSDVFCRVTDWRPEQLFTQSDGQFDSWYHQYECYLGQADGESAQRYLQKAELTWKEIDAPDTLEDIGRAAKPGDYMGLVYADGNNVGALIEKIRTAGHYRQFATRLFQATQVAVFEALATHLQPLKVASTTEKLPYLHPFEIVNIGGDDLFLIVPADKALPIAHSIATTIEQIFSVADEQYVATMPAIQRYRPDAYAPPGKPLISMAAGVVLSAKNTPIFFLLDLVEELLKSAKQGAKARKQAGYLGSMVDFMSLKGVGMVTSGVKDFRLGALAEHKSETNEELHLTARPYTIHELAGLLTTARTLKTVNFPRSQLHHLRELLPKGRLISSLSYLYFSSRLRAEHRSDREDFQALLRREFDQAWHIPATEPLPWRRRRAWKQAPNHPDPTAHWETVFADLVEVYDFVGKVEEA